MHHVPLTCPTCGQRHHPLPVHPGTVVDCARCGLTILRRAPDSLNRTAAFALAALILYVPANLFPIMTIQMHGRTTHNTALQGTTRLFEAGDYAIAIVVFLASILIPLLKLIGLFLLVASVKLGWGRARVARARMHKAVEIVGRWAMLDVFVVAVLVSLVKLQGLATIIPGSGLFAFGAVVVCTILASASFDSHCLWESAEKEP